MGRRYTGEAWETARRKAFDRDDSRCQSCGRRDELHAHHVRPVRSFDTPEDAHFVDNLVVLCKQCHGIWEGRNTRPRLADMDTETAIEGVVARLTTDTMWRHCLPAALPGLMSREIAGDPALCSKCFTRIGGRPEFTILRRFREMLRAVAFHERSLPKADLERYNQPPVENYCQKCASRVADSGATHFFEGGKIRIRHARSYRVWNLLTNAGLEFEHEILAHYGDHAGRDIHQEWETEALCLTLSIAKALGYPRAQLTDINPHLAVTDREVREPDTPPPESRLSYNQWMNKTMNSSDGLENTESVWK